MDIRATYLAAGTAFAALVGRVGPDGWDRPGLGVWTLRDLLGHAVSAGLREVVNALDHPADTVAMDSPEGYYALARTVDPAVYAAAVAASTDLARADGAGLGPDLAGTVGDLVATVADRLRDVPPTALVTTAAGGMVLDAWLPTRTFELVVHGLDIAASAGVPAELPDRIVTEAAVLAARIAGAVGDGATALLALTGRRTLPGGFSVV